MIQQKKSGIRLTWLAWILLWASAAAPVEATVFTYVTIPSTGNATSGNIQTVLINTFPTGTFVANNALATPFSIPDAPGNCGLSEASPCNFYIFPTSGSGTSVTLNVSISSPTDVYTLINSTSPPPGQQLGTIQFIGTGGVKLTFSLIAGKDSGTTIRAYLPTA